MYTRKDKLVTGNVYHIFSKSISGFKIFNNKSEFSRMLGAICYYRKKPSLKFSKFIISSKGKGNYLDATMSLSKEQATVQIIAYCLMPTHFHLIIKQLMKDSISIFMSNTLNSYSRYFNTRHNRKGPLWEGRFKNVLVETNEQLLHLTRYIHLNPVTAYLCSKPEEWLWSSYNEYISSSSTDIKLCEFDDVLDIEAQSYRKFVKDRASYQRGLAAIKKFLMEQA